MITKPWQNRIILLGDKYHMRKFMKIVESITTDMVINNQIEEKLSHYPDGDKTLIRDGLETIYNAGSAGVGIAEWVAAMKAMWTDADNENLKRIFKLIMGDFASLVQRSNIGRYVWTVAPERHDGELDMNDPMTQMASAQIRFTAEILDICRHLVNFTIGDVVREFADSSGMDDGSAGIFVQHVIDNNSGTIKSEPMGRYRFDNGAAALTPAQHMNTWRELARRAGDIDDIN